MNNLITNPVGIDKAIEALQISLYNELQLLSTSIKAYGRVFKNAKDSGFVLETFIEGTNEYRDVLSGEDTRFFFYLHDTINGDTDVTAKVDLVCMVNLNTLFNASGRRDEEFRAIVSNVLHRSRFKQLKIVIGMEYIERLASGLYERANLSYSDMHPYHAVTFQTEVNYKLKTC